MTDFDRKLIDKANRTRRWDYRDIDALIAIAETNEARLRLRDIRQELRDLTKETY